MVYGGQRKTTQYQAIPPSAQVSPLSAGGVIGLSRDYGGVDLRWIAVMTLAGRPFELVAGLGLRRPAAASKRTGYENFIGPVAQSASWACRAGCAATRPTRSTTSTPMRCRPPGDLADRWTLEAGARRSTVDFRSRRPLHRRREPQRQSGSAALQPETLPVASLRYQATADLASVPSGGQGLRDADAQRAVLPPAMASGGLQLLRCSPRCNDSVEVGARRAWLAACSRRRLSETRTDDEIVHRDQRRRPRHLPERAGALSASGFEPGLAARDRRTTGAQLGSHLAGCALQRRLLLAVPCNAGSFVPVRATASRDARQSLFASYGWAPPERLARGAPSCG